MKRVVIVGGGMTGLAAAHYVQKWAKEAGHSIDVHLFEASARWGGTVHTTSRDGFLLEGGPDCFLAEKPSLVELCRRLGLGDELLPTQSEYRRSFIVRAGVLHPVPEGFYLLGPSQLRPFLASSILSWRGRWRVLAESLVPARPQSDESVGAFVRRRLGKECLDWLGQPLLAGIYAADPDTLSLKATFPQFLEMEELYGSILVGLKKRGAATQNASGARYSLFLSLKNGMQSLTERLAEGLPATSLHLNTIITGLRRTDQDWEVYGVKGQRWNADAVVLAVPAYVAATLLSDIDETLAEQLRTVTYSGSATINLAFKEEAIKNPLSGFGFVTPHAERRSTLACTFVHRKFPGRAPAGHALLRAFVGGALQESLLRLDDADLIRRITQDLNQILGITQPPLFATLERWPRAMPQYTVGHVRRTLDIEERQLGMPGLALAGNWLHGVGLTDCVESAERAATTVLQNLSQATPLSLP